MKRAKRVHVAPRSVKSTHMSCVRQWRGRGRGSQAGSSLVWSSSKQFQVGVIGVAIYVYCIWCGKLIFIVYKLISKRDRQRAWERRLNAQINVKSGLNGLFQKYLNNIINRFRKWRVGGSECWAGSNYELIVESATEMFRFDSVRFTSTGCEAWVNIMKSVYSFLKRKKL